MPQQFPLQQPPCLGSFRIFPQATQAHVGVLGPPPNLCTKAYLSLPCARSQERCGGHRECSSVLGLLLLLLLVLLLLLIDELSQGPRPIQTLSTASP